MLIGDNNVNDYAIASFEDGRYIVRQLIVAKIILITPFLASKYGGYQS